MTFCKDWTGSCAWTGPQELDVNIFSVPAVYPLRSKGKDGHSAATQIVSGWITPLLFRLKSRAYAIWINNRGFIVILFFLCILILAVWCVHSHLCCFVLFYCASITANVSCHLIGQYMMTECSNHLDQSDDTIHLLWYLRNRREQNNKDGRARITRLKSAEDRACNCLFKWYTHEILTWIITVLFIQKQFVQQRSDRPSPLLYT